MKKSINSIVSNDKRFMAYEIIQRLKEMKLLKELELAVSTRERKNGHGDPAETQKL